MSIRTFLSTSYTDKERLKTAMKTDETRPERFLKWLLFSSALVSFLVCETMLATIYVRGFRPPLFLSGMLNVYTICLVTSIPAIVGLKGFWDLDKRIVSHNFDTRMIVRFQNQFSFGVIGSYAVISLLIQMFYRQ